MRARVADTEWWRSGVVYQIYPRSFADANGDGDGDLQGIIDHLDHLGPDGLGIDAIWLSPFYRSPWHDGGYDISDHAAVDPRFGREADFDRLVAEAHRRGIRVILDLVLNHTSNEHRWFEASRQAPGGPYGDFYLWRDMGPPDASGERQPPNNWRSFFGGPGWQWDDVRKQAYFHTFLVEQPELNWRGAGVEAAQLDVVRGWLERGVDGFRLDVFNVFLKDPALRSNPPRPDGSGWSDQLHVNDRDHPDLGGLLQRFRDVVDAYPGRMTVGELFDGPTDRAAELTSGHHLVFDWELLESAWSASALRAAIDHREAAFGPERWPTLVFSNHDRERHASRLAETAGISDVDAVARASALLLLALRGTPFLYYGEEIGARDVDIAPSESVDPPAAQLPGWWDRSRCRTPMAWTGEPDAGFGSTRPWLRFAPDIGSRNVADQLLDPGSVLACYRRLLAARRDSAALNSGTFEWQSQEPTSVLGWRRRAGGDEAVVLLNVADAPAEVEVAFERPVRSVVGTLLEPSRLPSSRGRLTLKPLEGLIAFLEPS
ncbi:MAG TPA: alpha-amylase family glycosyl hydrolase [Candidatus Polarisedimenticolia bacterium]|nr:alpha-amylase family glycosyl hydrolase [Candidatus Polarisedimenticolia bacterium]